MKFLKIKKKAVLKYVVLSTVLLIASSCSEEEAGGTDEISAIPELLGDARVASTVDTTTHKEHDFDDESLDPFTEDQGFTGTDIFNEGMGFHDDLRGGKRLKLTWKESEYDGSRRERGHEIKLQVTTNEELFSGFYLNIPSGQSNNLLNKNTIIWQLYNWNSDGCSNWTAHLELKDDDLYLSYRAACVDPTVIKIYDNIPTNTDLAFRIRNDISGDNTGVFVVYLDDVRIANVRNINYGFGNFDSNDDAETSVVGVKMGMYCFDTTNYTTDEKRILYLDNVGVTTRNGSVSNSFDMIDPDNM